MKEDIKMLLLKHNMALNMLQTINNFQRCAGAGLLGVLSPHEEQVINSLTVTIKSIEDLCMQYYDLEENQSIGI